jgi:acetolactate synthase-1/2/3 large subunit
MNFCEYFWKIIEEENIEYAFGLPGGPILDILYNIPSKIKWIDTGNELNNGFISQIYGKFSDKVGVLIVTLGPGIATAISAISNAVNENLPLVVVSVLNESKDDFQAFDIKNISNNITKHTFIINTSDELIYKLKKAFYVAKNLNTAVVILINKELNLKNEEIIGPKIHNDFEKYCNFDNKDAIVNLLNKNINTENLLVIIGKIPNTNFDTIKNFIIRNKLPYITTWKERTIFCEKYYCGRLGSLGNHSANYAIYHSKNLLILGDTSSKLHNKYYSNKYSTIFTENKDNIYSIVNKSEDAIKDSTNIFITNQYEYILKNLNVDMSKKMSAWLNILSKSNNNLLFNLQPKSILEKYCQIACSIYSLHNMKIPVVTGVGNHWFAFGKYFNSTNLHCWATSTTWASLGCGYCYGLGAYLATKKPIWIFDGDGGTLFSGNLLLYLINNKDLPITVTIFNNYEYASIVQGFHMRHYKKTLNAISKVNKIDYSILPNCHHFYDFKEYYTYLNKYPISNKLRFIIINIKQKIPDNNSFIYEIDILNNKYIDALRNSDFISIQNLPQVDKLDVS